MGRKISVNPSDLRTGANKLEKLSAEYKTTIGKLKAAIEQLEIPNAEKTALLQQYAKMEQGYNSINDFLSGQNGMANALRDVAKNYEAKKNEAISLIQR